MKRKRVMKPTGASIIDNQKTQVQNEDKQNTNTTQKTKMTR